ncbi:MAG: alpha/beta hydrolase [Gemmatimonadota bacterium]
MTLPGLPVETELPLGVRRVGKAGDSSRAFVLVHGFGGSSFTWRDWAPRLGEVAPTYTVDLTGFGDAPKPRNAPYDPASQADSLVGLIDEIGASRVTLVGHSMGGGIALLTALHLASSETVRVDAIVLIGAAAYRQKLPPFVALSKRPRLSTALVRAIGARRIVHATLRSIVYDSATVNREQIAAYARPLETDEGLYAAMVSGRNILPEDIDEVSSRYAELDMPALCLWGDHDRVIPLWVGRRLAEEIPGGELVILPRCGHVPPEEQPQESLQVVENFLREHSLWK